MIDKELMDILACPVCKQAVRLDEAQKKICCSSCGRQYPVRDGIPVMLEEEAEMADAGEKKE